MFEAYLMCFQKKLSAYPIVLASSGYQYIEDRHKAQKSVKKSEENACLSNRTIALQRENSRI